MSYDLSVHGTDGPVQSSYPPFMWASISNVPSLIKPTQFLMTTSRELLRRLDELGRSHTRRPWRWQ